ncbi:MAG: shikimate kinase [Deltaproteobacteria bacterium]|nr:shikimate kinase [Deltaproteobacteria bacterium]
MNIVLIGYRCSGKSLVGKTLADYLGLELVDTDQVLEGRVGSPIPHYVAENGWEAFRMLEKMIIRSIANHDQRVIATGGGVVLDWENVRNLKETGWVVWLRTSITSIRERMGQDEVSGKVRPGLTGDNPLEEIEEILSQRTALYERACHYIVNTDQQSPDAVAQDIIQSLPEALIPVQDRGLPQGIVHDAALNP